MNVYLNLEIWMHQTSAPLAGRLWCLCHFRLFVRSRRRSTCFFLSTTSTGLNILLNFVRMNYAVTGSNVYACVYPVTRTL